MKKFVLTSIEKTLNAYLLSDTDSHKRLSAVAGKSVSVELTPLQLVFVCQLHQQGVHLHSNKDEIEPQTKIKGSPMQLMGALIDKDRRHQFFADDLTIEGDAELAQQVIQLFDQVSIDWEEHASRLIGDVPAYQLSKLVSSVRGWLKKASSNLSQDANDFLHEEAAWFPAREQLQEFFAEIDDIRMDTDRLEARIAHVKSQLHKEGTK